MTITTTSMTFHGKLPVKRTYRLCVMLYYHWYRIVMIYRVSHVTDDNTKGLCLQNVSYSPPSSDQLLVNGKCSPRTSEPDLCLILHT